MSLRVKFTFVIFFLLCVVIVGFSYSVYVTQKKILQEQLEENRERVFKDFSATCKESLVVKDEILVFNTIKSIVETHRPQIVYAGYISAGGSVYLISRDENFELEFGNRMRTEGEEEKRVRVNIFESPL